MKIFVPILLFAVMFSDFGAVICYSQKKDSVVLRLHLMKGDTYSVSINTQAAYKVNKMSFTEQLNGDLFLSVGEQGKGEKFVLTITLNNFAMNMYSDSGTLMFALDSRDSTKRARKKDSVLFENAKNIIGLTFWEELNERAEPLRTNLDTVIKHVKADKAILGVATAICYQILSFISFSENPVNIGENWKGVGWKNTEGKVLSVNSLYTLNAIHDSVAEISFASKSWGNAPDGNELLTIIAGESKVDIRSGLPVESHLITDLKATGSREMKGNAETTIRIEKR